MLLNSDARGLDQWFEVSNQHKGSNVILRFATLEECREHAEAAASLGYDGFYRVFEHSGEFGELANFKVAFSVLGGVVREHADVTIPLAHW